MQWRSHYGGGGISDKFHNLMKASNWVVNDSMSTSNCRICSYTNLYNFYIKFINNKIYLYLINKSDGSLTLYSEYQYTAAGSNAFIQDAIYCPREQSIYILLITTAGYIHYIKYNESYNSWSVVSGGSYYMSTENRPHNINIIKNHEGYPVVLFMNDAYNIKQLDRNGNLSNAYSCFFDSVNILYRITDGDRDIAMAEILEGGTYISNIHVIYYDYISGNLKISDSMQASTKATAIFDQDNRFLTILKVAESPYDPNQIYKFDLETEELTVIDDNTTSFRSNAYSTILRDINGDYYLIQSSDSASDISKIDNISTFSISQMISLPNLNNAYLPDADALMNSKYSHYLYSASNNTVYQYKTSLPLINENGVNGFIKIKD